MSKTKHQLRAEAVERLMHAELRAGVFFQDIVTALVGWGGGAMGTVERVRDLLTDDELGNSVESEGIEGSSEVRAGSSKPDLEAENEPVNFTESDGVDAREKLEADVRWQMGHFFAWDEKREEFVGYVLKWLDRQAAITEREQSQLWREELREWEKGAEEARAELQAKVDEQKKMLADSRELFSGMRKQRDEMQAKVDELTAESGAWPTMEQYNELQEENARLRTCMASDSEQHAEALRENRRLRGERDHWRNVAGKHAAEVHRLGEQLEACEGIDKNWPRFSDGQHVAIGDEMLYGGKAERVQGIRFYSTGIVFEFPGVDHCRETHGFAFGQGVDRPPLTAKDGKPIEPGQTLYGEDGKAWTVGRIDHGSHHPVMGTCGVVERGLKPEWLTHESPETVRSLLVEMKERIWNAHGVGFTWDDFGLSGIEDEFAERIEKLFEEGDS